MSEEKGTQNYSTKLFQDTLNINMIPLILKTDVVNGATPIETLGNK